jgi:hypothetical protein
VILKGIYKGLGARVLRVNRLAGAWALEATVRYLGESAVVVILTETDQFKIAEESP